MDSLDDNNELRMYYTLYDRVCMMELAESGNEEPGAQADEIARELVSFDRLPLFIRIRACRVLASSSAPDYLEWAHEGVRVAQLAYDNAALQATADRPVGGEAVMLAKAKEDLQDAQADFDRLGGYGEDEGEEEDDEEEGEHGNDDEKAAEVDDEAAAETDPADNDGTSS